VLVVGSAKSGCQIVEDLLQTDRKGYLSTSRVGKVRRRQHGKDVAEWMQRIGNWSGTAADLEDPALQLEHYPLVTGVNGSHTISLQSLWRAGVNLLGRLEPDAAPLGSDPADEVDTDALGIPPSGKLDLAEAGITTIIWATGFTGDYGWLKIPDAINGNGVPLQTCGVSLAQGVSFVGMPWLRTRSSTIIYGADADGTAIAQHIVRR
jgi:putative flavoprotein involved in K+ transport